MKIIIRLVAGLLLLVPLLFVSPRVRAQRITDMDLAQQPDSIMQWFKDAKFGMFIHMGVYAVYGKAEWYLYNARLDFQDYIKAAYPQTGNYFDLDKYDPSQWVSIAQGAGMKYMVLTARHHDGFDLFDSHFPGSLTTQQTVGRDVVGEYVKACREAGMKIGLYYSLLNWQYPGYFDVSGTDAKPNNFGITTAPWHRQNALLMKEELYTQIKELMTRYGQIDDLWWDGGWLGLQGKDRDGAYFWEPGMYRNPQNEWAGDYGVQGNNVSSEGRYLGIMGMVRKYQPYILANARSGWAGDYANEEGPKKIEGPIRKEYWEKCFSLDKNGWGYTFQQDVYSSGEIIDYLVNAVIRNGNLLLNVGPDQHGEIPKEQVIVLGEIGEWLRKTGESIFGTAAGPWNPVDGQYGFTSRQNKIYVHLLAGYKGDSFTLPGPGRPVAACYDVFEKRKLPYAANADGTISIKNIDRKESPYDTVVEVVLE